MGRSKEVLITAAVVLVSTFVLAALSNYGASNRTYLDRPVVRVLKSPYEAFSVWKESGVKGRVLFHMDRKIRADSTGKDSAPLSDDNYVHLSIRENLVRKVFHVIPDDEWATVEKALINRPSFTFFNGIFRTTIEGAPLLILRTSDIKHIGEKALLNINGDPTFKRQVQQQPLRAAFCSPGIFWAGC